MLPNTLILGDNKAIECLSEGDHCVGQSGLVHIAKTHRRHYSGPLVELRGKGLQPITLTADHPVLIGIGQYEDIGARYGYWAHSNGFHLLETRWVKAREVQVTKVGYKHPGQYLIVPRIKGSLHVASLDLSQWTNAHGRRVALGRGLRMSLPLMPTLAWLMGLYTAEGIVTKKAVGFCLGHHEKQLQEKTCRAISSLGYRPWKNIKPTATIVELPSRILSRAFSTLIGHRATQKKIPDIILFNNSNDVLQAFISGYEAGDAYLRHYTTVASKALRAVTTSRILAMQLQLCYARLGYFAAIHLKQKRTHPQIEGRNVTEHDGYELSYTTTGKKRVAKVLPDMILVPIKTVKSIEYSGPVHNLETSDGTYLIESIVTHNCRGILEIVPGYRSQAHLVSKCLRCHQGVALPSKFLGRCKLYSDSTHNELIEESEIAGLIGPKCQSCKWYNDAIMNPRLHPVHLKRCPQLDMSYSPSKLEVENFFTRFRDVDAEETRKEARKRLDILPPQDWIPP